MILDTTQLRMGDVVISHGMRVKLDRPPFVYQVEARHGGDLVTVYAWPGLVLNPFEAIEQYAIPYGFLFDASDHYDHDAGHWVRSTRPAWTVQGNHRVKWSVEREHIIGC